MVQPERTQEQARKLADLISYEPGRITSRSIVDTRSGVIVLHSFAQGQGMSERKAQSDSLVFVLDGEAEVIIASKTTHLNTGEYIVIPGSAHFALMAIKQFKVMMVILKT